MVKYLTTIGYLALGLFGLYLLFASGINPPIEGSVVMRGGVGSDTGVHLDSDGTIDYYEGDTNQLYDHARLVFLFLMALGATLVGLSIHYLKHRYNAYYDSTLDTNQST